MSEAQHAPEGQVIEGRYRVVSRIADGGMATVYQAVDERLGRTVAIKIMHTQLAIPCRLQVNTSLSRNVF